MRRSNFVAALLFAALCSGAEEQSLVVRVSWGHRAPAAGDYFVKISGDEGVRVRKSTGFQMEVGDRTDSGGWRTRAGGGDVDGVDLTLEFAKRAEPRLQKLHIIWADLIAAGDADTARRLGNDAAMDPHSPRLFIQTSEDGTRGFAVTVDQLQRERAFWVPSLDVFVTAGEPLVEFAQHAETLKPREGLRILEQVRRAPEARYEEFAARWADLGSPTYTNPQPTGSGHIICLAWDSSIHKFGIDRGAGVRNDFGNPDHFQFWFDFGDITQGITGAFQRQGLTDGLPIVTTVFERDGVRYEVEQFAYPLDGPPASRRGDIPMVLMQRLRVSSLDGQPRRVPVTLSHRRAFPAGLSSAFEVERVGQRLTARDTAFGSTVLEIDGADGEPVWAGVRDYDNSGLKRLNVTVPLDLPARGSREMVVKLPSPMVDPQGTVKLRAIDYAAARAETMRFWSTWLEKGADFIVPEKVVNDLFRANLWHALRLPRRHGGEGSPRIDLPYSNFAYSQTGTPWPVNQSVYVDYMPYALRGYPDVAVEELETQYRNNQEINGHVSGFANWLAYTPGMLYATAQTYFLSGDRRVLDRLMGDSLKALDWCLRQVALARQRGGPAQGLVEGPLNDLTGEGLWAFNQAYLYAGLELFGRALEEAGNPRGAEARAAARELAVAIERGFRTASAKSPLIQLRDHTWVPYVPCEANRFGRILDDWYPTDVDTGAVHLLRLKAIPATSDLAGWLLNDHEDNLYYKGWGIANEPVYNQQGTAYLLRDDPPAVIRTFYSYMASAFSHSALEPVEHRWTHGQYFDPPSTDGAWFELYRNMLVQETDDDSLLLAGFTPRHWLADGRRIEVRRAPTRLGLLTMRVESHAAAGRIEADVEMPDRKPAAALLVRLRHPSGTRMRSVMVNGRNWTEFDPEKEWVRVPRPGEKHYSIVARY